MIQLAFTKTEISADTAVKQGAAVRQMNELLERLSAAPKYHTLTKNDRAQLSREGYAADLVDNLVLITQRRKESTVTDNDNLVVGFTYAAFDPALYANEALKNHFKQMSQGCCSFCESFLMPTSSGHISHYRPVQLLDLEGVEHTNPNSECSPYFSQAYQQENLVYVCSGCDVTYKAGRFPVAGERFPHVALSTENALLVNPYQENPRDFIRFNPCNGHAYPFDQICAFYADTQKLTEQDIEALLWKTPSAIPNQVDEAGTLLTDSVVEQAFALWLKSESSQGGASRGAVSIATLGLNRSDLVLARLVTLKQYHNDFIKHKAALAQPLISEDIATIAYRSLALDAFATWQSIVNGSGNSTGNSTGSNLANDEGAEGTNIGANEDTNVANNCSLMANTIHKLREQANKAVENPELDMQLPSWFRSCVSYLVLESELQQVGKRRLVLLCNQDRLYGATDTEKCIFLPINWQQDLHKVIKVRSKRNIWEASFSELASTRPHELINVFANNDVWVEGDFPSLA
ncbi:hypothetical protein [Shewanella sp.]|uniref:hypothetical protein n=1 Tax=Shewanella sp. TaxID=50422 RepID=UPI0040539D23